MPWPMMLSSARCGLGGPQGANSRTTASSESLRHATWAGTSHVVLIPQGRKQARYGKSRSFLGPVWREWAGQRGSPIVAGPRGQAHGHRLSRLPPQYAVAEVMGGLARARVPSPWRTRVVDDK